MPCRSAGSIRLWHTHERAKRGSPLFAFDVRNLFIEGEASIDTPDALRLHHTEVREPRFARAFSRLHPATC